MYYRWIIHHNKLVNAVIATVFRENYGHPCWRRKLVNTCDLSTIALSFHSWYLFGRCFILFGCLSGWGKLDGMAQLLAYLFKAENYIAMLWLFSCVILLIRKFIFILMSNIAVEKKLLLVIEIEFIFAKETVHYLAIFKRKKTNTTNTSLTQQLRSNFILFIRNFLQTEKTGTVLSSIQGSGGCYTPPKWYVNKQHSTS